MRFSPPGLGRQARLARAADVADLRAIAKRRTPAAAFDYVDGAAKREVTARRSREVFDSVELLPRILHGIAEPDLSVDIAGAHSALPFGIAPTGARAENADVVLLGEADGVTIACRDGALTEVRICLTRDLQPRDCAPDSRRDCTGALLMEAPG